LCPSWLPKQEKVGLATELEIIKGMKEDSDTKTNTPMIMKLLYFNTSVMRKEM
jgi:hypothetical protein